MTESIWQLKDVSLVSGRTARLSGIDLQIQPGVTAVLGASGAGKSSLLSLLAGFERSSSGTIEFAAVPDAGQLPLFWSPQDHGLWPKLTVREHLATVLPESPRLERSVDEWLTLLRLGTVADALPHRLSQGERSRLSLGRSLASEAVCLVLDEPLAHVDPIHCCSYLDLIADHAKRLGGSVVFSTHDPGSVLRSAERVVCLSETRCIFSGPVNELYFNPPTEEAAWLLGPANWFGEDSDVLRAAIDENAPRCIRPHELVVADMCGAEAVADDSSKIDLIATNRVGAVLEVTASDVENRRLRLLTADCPAELTPGSALRLAYQPDSRRK